ncbi:NAD(P)/FAD-dependent oxidoreductase [Caenispirillum bisanense]|uniref:Gamma-glutamylputrescine oxidase n=1 Tax=Caenispirillum bisanense TaxID=414052 RepID=A0A286GHD3_9PROT|nr:FAD-binding oxidoreductase [Caenispirillum bisanense]SOD94920.1 gamma-glutamylputrescine oxidase [Caenispirillum bisanense]
MTLPPHTPSYYAASANPFPEHPPLQGEVTADVCVVGGGMTGCSAALHLAERGYKVVLIESQRIGWGASGRSGGQLIAGYATDMSNVEKHVAPEDAKTLWDMSVEAIDSVKEHVARHAIACDYRPGHIHVGVKPRHERELHDLAEEWQRYGYGGLQYLDRAAVRERVDSERYTCGLYDPAGGHIHPLNYTLGLAAAAEKAGAMLYETTPMVRWEKGDPAVVVTPQGRVTAKWVVMAGNAYLWETERKLGQTIMPVGTYILATEPLGENRAAKLIPQNEAVADILFVLNYFRRSADHRMLFGGKVSYSRIDPGNVAESMRRTMLHYFPQLSDVKVDFAWGGYVAITVNRLPDFGRLAPNVIYAQGFSGHGVGLTTLAGRLMAETVAGQAERFDLIGRLPTIPFPGGTLFRTPALVLAMAWRRLRDAL